MTLPHDRGQRPALALIAIAAAGLLAGCQTTGGKDASIAALPNASDLPAAEAGKPTGASPARNVGAALDKNISENARKVQDALIDNLAPEQAALLRLRRARVAFATVPDVRTARGCGYEGALEVSGVGDLPFSKPATIRRELAVKVAQWIEGTVKPAAEQILKQPIKQIVVWSSYSCRTARGRRWGGQRHRLSQHALGNAIDIGGFILQDGTFIAYRQHWHRKGPESDFLKATSAEACGQFSKVLTPDYDWVHRHHIHLDMAKGSLCGMKGRFEHLLRNRVASAKPAGPKDNRRAGTN